MACQLQLVDVCTLEQKCNRFSLSSASTRSLAHCTADHQLGVKSRCRCSSNNQFNRKVTSFAVWSNAIRHLSRLLLQARCTADHQLGVKSQKQMSLFLGHQVIEVPRKQDFGILYLYILICLRYDLIFQFDHMQYNHSLSLEGHQTYSVYLASIWSQDYWDLEAQ